MSYRVWITVLCARLATFCWMGTVYDVWWGIVQGAFLGRCVMDVLMGILSVQVIYVNYVLKTVSSVSLKRRVSNVKTVM